MEVNGQRGFTILETTLFLALSALLFATLVFGIQYMIARSRFSDTMSDLRTVIQSEYEEVRSGINTREVLTDVCGGGSNNAPGTGNCLAMGKVIQFDANKSNIDINYLVGKADSTAISSDGDLGAIKKAEPQITYVAEEKKEIQWSAEFARGMLLNNGSSSPITGIAIVRSPISSSIVVYTLSSKLGVGEKLSTTDTNLKTSAVFVVKNMGNGGASGGAVCVNAGSNSAGVSAVAPVEPTAELDQAKLKELEAQCRR